MIELPPGQLWLPELIAAEEKATICINYSTHNTSSTVQAINLSQTRLGLSLQLVLENKNKKYRKRQQNASVDQMWPVQKIGKTKTKQF